MYTYFIFIVNKGHKCKTSFKFIEEHNIDLPAFNHFELFVFQLLAFPSATLKRKLQDSFTILNWLELVNMVLAFVSFGLRINDVFYAEAKTIYCTNVVIFYIRIIQVYTSNSHLGPKLYMIIRMVKLYFNILKL